MADEDDDFALAPDVDDETPATVSDDEDAELEGDEVGGGWVALTDEATAVPAAAGAAQPSATGPRPSSPKGKPSGGGG